MEEKKITESQFKVFVEKAFEEGFRMCYIKKINTSLMFKGNIYFNISGIYKFDKGRFVKLADLTEESMKKFLEAK